MINPAPYRAPHPIDMPQECDERLSYNLEIIETYFKEYKGATILCGWGEYIYSAPEWYKESLNRIVSLMSKYNLKPVSIKTNKSGQPRHLSSLNREKEFARGNGTYSLNTYTIKV